MKLLCYENGTHEGGKRLQQAIEGVVPAINMEICRTVKGLSTRLRQRLADLAVVVLYPATKEELLEILHIRDLLDDVPILLVLPDRDSDTFSKGLFLFPRFVSFADSDFSDVSVVLSRMLKVYSRKYADPQPWR